jgi:8-oxo-dGTP pyrophosphatase MutT (NUDIX family)
MTFEEDFEARAYARLDPLDALGARVRDDFDPRQLEAMEARTYAPAAVLAPVIRRPDGYTVLLTQRSPHMPSHAGQVAFPGGRVQPEDGGVVAAALREAYEETGLAPEFVTPVGGFDAYRTGTNFVITPVLAFVEPGFTLNPDPREVDAVFETPLTFLMSAANHELHSREFEGKLRHYYAMPWEGRYIWGVTAGIIKALYHRLYDEDA